MLGYSHLYFRNSNSTHATDNRRWRDATPQGSTAFNDWRFAALSRGGSALRREKDETCLLSLIAETACELTGVAYAAFSLRPVNAEGQPLGPAEGGLFQHISIRDEGMGIPASQQSGVGGTGLALYLCRELVELHRGHSWFTSREGAGSTFFLTLPLQGETM